jgi:hypothetical protein
LGKAEAPQEFVETGVRVQAVEAGLDFHKRHTMVPLLISLFQPFERLIVLTEPGVSRSKTSGGT